MLCSATTCDRVHLRRCTRADALALVVTARSRANTRTHTETRAAAVSTQSTPRNVRCSETIVAMVKGYRQHTRATPDFNGPDSTATKKETKGAHETS